MVGFGGFDWVWSGDVNKTRVGLELDRLRAPPLRKYIPAGGERGPSGGGGGGGLRSFKQRLGLLEKVRGTYLFRV